MDKNNINTCKICGKELEMPKDGKPHLCVFKMSPEFEAAVRRAKRRGKLKPYHFPSVRD